MELGYNIKIQQQQKLAMTPELIQAIKILQYNNVELNSYIQDQLLSNPVLEKTSQEKSSSEELGYGNDQVDSYLEDYGSGNYNKQGGYDNPSYSGGNEESSYEKYVASKVTLKEHLSFQLQLAVKNKEDNRIGSFLIESLDDNGYLTIDVDTASRLLGQRKEHVEEILRILQEFDPIGVFATSLSDCLKRQLEYEGQLSEEAQIILDKYMDKVADNKLGYIAKELDIPVSRVQSICDKIKTLNPKPGLVFADNGKTTYIVPDILVREDNGEYVVIHNDNSMPRLMVSSYYEKLMKQKNSDKELVKYLREKVDSAIWLMRSIEQRKNTIESVAKVIVMRQREFFARGPKGLTTLTLKDVADELDIHESTVSRTINGKYLDCSRGVFELKYFFSAGVLSEGGEDISSRGVKSHIEDLVKGEDPKSPLSDQKIVNILLDKGIEISRRTVAKYRDELGIPSSSKRKRY